MDENNNTSLTTLERLAIYVQHITPMGLEAIKEQAREEAAEELKKYTTNWCPCECCRLYK